MTRGARSTGHYYRGGQVNGKLRSKLDVASDISKQDMEH